MRCDNFKVCGNLIREDSPRSDTDVPALILVNGQPMEGYDGEPTNKQKLEFQGDRAFHFTITGGYGEFTDICGGNENPEVLLCHECGHKLVATFPFLAEVLRGGHPHDVGELVDAVDWTFVDKDDHSKKWDGKDYKQVVTLFGDGTIMDQRKN